MRRPSRSRTLMQSRLHDSSLLLSSSLARKASRRDCSCSPSLFGTDAFTPSDPCERRNPPAITANVLLQILPKSGDQRLFCKRQRVSTDSPPRQQKTKTNAT